MTTPHALFSVTAVTAVVGVVLTLTACDGLLGGGGGNGAGKLTATWSVKNVDGSAAQCQPGFRR